MYQCLSESVGFVIELGADGAQRSPAQVRRRIRPAFCTRSRCATSPDSSTAGIPLPKPWPPVTNRKLPGPQTPPSCDCVTYRYSRSPTDCPVHYTTTRPSPPPTLL